MTSEGLGEMFEGDSADMCAGKFLLVSMGGRAKGLACADPGARTPISASGNFFFFFYLIFSTACLFVLIFSVAVCLKLNGACCSSLKLTSAGQQLAPVTSFLLS